MRKFRTSGARLHVTLTSRLLLLLFLIPSLSSWNLLRCLSSFSLIVTPARSNHRSPIVACLYLARTHKLHSNFNSVIPDRSIKEGLMIDLFVDYDEVVAECVQFVGIEPSCVLHAIIVYLGKVLVG